MTALLAELFLYLENTTWAVTIRQSSWLYPALEVVHIVGIVCLAGAAFLFDLRLLGFGRELPVKALANHLLTWSRRGLLLVVPSGLFLFITDARELGYNPTFWLKMTLLVVAGLNALVFHQFTFRTVGSWSTNITTPNSAKAAGLFSIILWLSIIACGRWLAY
jgi:hypothetical protein